MLFTPNYTVSYKGVFHPAGKPFDIDPKDRTEMERHGTVWTEIETKEIPSAQTSKVEVGEIPDKPVIRKGGRPRKVSA